MSDKDMRLEYFIKYKSSEISDADVIPLLIQTIEEEKKRNPEKAEALDNIEITKGISAHILSVDVDTILNIVVVLNVTNNILKPIILETWHEIVIPLLKRKWNIESKEDYLDYLKKEGKKLKSKKKKKEQE